jgi:hypothetical protein
MNNSDLIILVEFLLIRILITLNCFDFLFNIWIQICFLFLIGITLRSYHFNIILNPFDCLLNFFFFSRFFSQFNRLSLIMNTRLNALNFSVFHLQIRFLEIRINSRRFGENIVTCLEENIVVKLRVWVGVWLVGSSYSGVRNDFELLSLNSHYKLFKFQIIKI